MAIRVQRHANVSKQATVLDGLDVSPLKSKGSFKGLQWKCKYSHMKLLKDD